MSSQYSANWESSIKLMGKCKAPWWCSIVHLDGDICKGSKQIVGFDGLEGVRFLISEGWGQAESWRSQQRRQVANVIDPDKLKNVFKHTQINKLIHIGYLRIGVHVDECTRRESLVKCCLISHETFSVKVKNVKKKSKKNWAQRCAEACHLV
jgi:hypothetical protein